MRILFVTVMAIVLAACEMKSVAEDAYAIQVGMTLKEVNAVLDREPYTMEQKGEIKRYVWLYTSHKIQRALYVDFKDGKVWTLPDTQTGLNGFRRE